MLNGGTPTNAYITEKPPYLFTVYFNGKSFGYFTSEAGAKAFLDCLIDGSGDDTMAHQEKTDGKYGGV